MREHGLAEGRHTAPMDYLFDLEADAPNLEDMRRLTTDIWADLAFDDAVKAALKRDGFAIHSVRLTGPSPFVLTASADGRMRVSADGSDDKAALMDLWRLHFVRRLRGPRGERDAA